MKRLPLRSFLSLALCLGLVVGLGCSAQQEKKTAAQANGDAREATGTIKKGSENKASGDRRYLLETIDGRAVVQLYADGFEQLSLNDKLLCYHLANAAIAGRDIFIDQKFGYGLEIKGLLEQFYLHKDSMDPAVAREVERYTKLFWLNNGLHDHDSTLKEILKLDKKQFSHALQKSGVQISPSRAVFLYEVMTSPDRFMSCTNKSPADGKDPLLASCNNLYENVTLEEAKAFDEKNPLNSRLVKQNGKLVEEVYRAGDGKDIPAGRYAQEIGEIVKHLRQAQAYAPAKTKASLEKLIRFYQTGAHDDWIQFDIAWVKDDKANVDFINGFIETYLDARSIKGAWEGLVFFQDPAQGAQAARLAQEAQWFEDRMPWEDEFKKKEVKGISFRKIVVVTETGDSGPFTPIGINLPNELEVRENHGSKSVNLGNVKEAYAAISGAATLEEFAWSREEVERARKWRRKAGDILTNLHEVVGHASGKVRPEVKNPAQVLGMYASTLEEARADLVGLYWLPHQKLKDLGIVEHEDVALAEYEAYSRNILIQLRRVPKGKKLEQDHMRNRQMVVFWLMKNTDAVEVKKRDGKTYYVVTSAEKFREGCGKLLAEVMRIKATGDFKAGKSLVDTYGTKVDPTLHQEVLDRLEPMNMPSRAGFVQPELKLVKGADGKVTDVAIWYPQDLADQMLRWAGKRK